MKSCLSLMQFCITCYTNEGNTREGLGVMSPLPVKVFLPNYFYNTAGNMLKSLSLSSSLILYYSIELRATIYDWSKHGACGHLSHSG